MSRVFRRGPSKIHGTGCFATKDLKTPHKEPVAGREALDWTDHVIDLCWGLFHLYSPFKYLNHSSNPNAEIVAGVETEFQLALLRGVKDGEEITIHYGEDWE